MPIDLRVESGTEDPFGSHFTDPDFLIMKALSKKLFLTVQWRRFCIGFCCFCAAPIPPK